MASAAGVVVLVAGAVASAVAVFMAVASMGAALAAVIGTVCITTMLITVHLEALRLTMGLANLAVATLVAYGIAAVDFAPCNNHNKTHALMHSTIGR